MVFVWHAAKTGIAFPSGVREREKMYLRDLLGFAAGAVGKKVSSS